MNRRTILRTALITAATGALASCGFHLRGSGAGSALSFKTIYIGFPESSSLGTELKRHIASGGTRVVLKPAEAEAILEVLAESKDKVVQSLNSQGRVREYALYYKVLIRVKDNREQELLPATEIVQKRDISFNESQVLAKETEEIKLYRDMQTDLVQNILRRLAAIKPGIASANS